MSGTKKIFLQIILFLFLMNSCSYPVFSQEEHLRNVVSLGVSTPLLDNGWGIHAGYHPVFSISNYFAVEGYAGYSYNQITGEFLSGEQGSRHSSELLIGPRLYFIKKHKKFRPYINLLAGIQLNLKKEASENELDINLGVSPGLYIDINKITLGFFLSTPEQMGFRFGYAL